MNTLQMAVSIVMFFVLFFGIGFILNMILKTTWLPLVLYFGFAGYLIFTLSSFHFADISVMISGLAGTIIGGWTIQTLRSKGYKMF
ncbi:hypothetical protein DL897_02730 [Thermoflavimicrobium daqui]|uniref:Uncharacterized protein n=2 Tax=Thermoflavimicrobium daqui TaxID=2137476 RepID=A0A364K9Z5_9BACL|nr:YuiB family protein [Thermoflavimicrobium daqui]RAL27126.1 hypothetical protein DL897_02730 [Thermoflavimicrobium daqui]